MGTRIHGIAIKTDVHKYDSEDIVKNLLSPYYQELDEQSFSKISRPYYNEALVVIHKTDEAIWISNGYKLIDSFFKKESQSIFEKFSSFFEKETLIICFQYSTDGYFGYSKIINGELIRCRLSDSDMNTILEIGEPTGIEAKWFQKPISLNDNKEEVYNDKDYDSYEQYESVICGSLNNRLTVCAMDDLMIDEVGMTVQDFFDESNETRYFRLYDKPVVSIKLDKEFWIPKRPDKEEYLKREKERIAKQKYDFQTINNQYFNQSIISSLWRDNEALAVYSFFIEKDLKKAKQLFYKCARLHEYSLKRFGNGVWNHDRIALLSDNQKVIRNYTRVLGLKEQNFMKTIGSWIYIQQCIIKGDYEAYKKATDLIKADRFNMDTFNKKTIGFCDALMEGNQTEMESILADFVTPKFHIYSNSYNTFKNYLSYTALKYAKLAWYKGFQVQVDSPLVPHELLPISPLQDEAYEDYDFVKKYLG